MTASGSQAEPPREQRKLALFEDLCLPHLNAAYNLARWITANDQDAKDLVQEAYLRALKSFGGFHEGDGRAWLLMIVRNTCYTWLRRNRSNELTTTFDEEIHSTPSHASNPEELLLQSANGDLLKKALQGLPREFREVVIMREVEGLSYRQIASICGVPVGTVMSRLARARTRLQQVLARPIEQGAPTTNLIYLESCRARRLVSAPHAPEADVNP